MEDNRWKIWLEYTNFKAVIFLHQQIIIDNYKIFQFQAEENNWKSHWARDAFFHSKKQKTKIANPYFDRKIK